MFAFSLTGRSVIWCGGLPRVSLRLPWAMNFCPFRACPLKRALIEGKLRSVGEIFPCLMPTSHIPHSQHFSPKSTRFFPSRPAPRPKTPFSAHFRNCLSFSRLSSECHRSTFPTRPSPPRNAIFRLSIPALSRLHPLPFASRSLSYRNSKHAQRRVRRSASSVQTDPFRPIRPATPAISPKNPTQVFHQKSLEC